MAKPSRRRFLKIAALTGGLAVAGGVGGATILVNNLAKPAQTRPYNGSLGPTLTISQELYRDKTLACILGQIAGTLTAYEFVSTSSLADEWFELMNGPYAGNFNNWSPPDTKGYVIYLGPGRIATNDDWHVDFFNQLIMSKHGINPSYQAIKDEWLYYGVSDWGGGFETMRLMKDEDMLPPQTGQGEYNRWYWVTEAFIETETIGCIAPGLPATARDLNEKFAMVVAEWEAVWWARFLSTAYSLAYFESDARVVLEKASVTLPRNSWNWQIYQKAQSLYAQNPADWRWAQGEMYQFRRKLAQTDNPMVNPDLLNGGILISGLYGNNDYLQTLKIASLIGNEAIDIASFATGLLGLIKGLDGTPQLVKDRVWADGKGVMVNDFERDPHFKQNYPAEQSFSDILKLYQTNAEKLIVATGGSIQNGTYFINSQELKPESCVLLENTDFEKGDLSNWQAWTSQPDSAANPHVLVENDGTAHSGDYKGTLITDEIIREAKLYVKLEGLEHGQTYRAYAFITTNQVARLFVDDYGGPYLYASVVESANSIHREWVSRTLEFVVKGRSAVIGLHLPPGYPGSASIDNLYIQPITNPTKLLYEAQKAQVTGGVIKASPTALNGRYVSDLNESGSKVEFKVSVPLGGEYRLAVNFANGGQGFSKLNLYLNGIKKAALTFPRTGSWGVFSSNQVEVPVVLEADTNLITLQKDGQTEDVELNYIELSAYPQRIY
jgi:hypothetical protein